MPMHSYSIRALKNSLGARISTAIVLIVRLHRLQAQPLKSLGQT